MTVSEAVCGILADAKKRGIRSVNVKISDRCNKRGRYGYLEVAYIVPYKRSSRTVERPPDPIQYFEKDLTNDEIKKKIVEAIPEAIDVSTDNPFDFLKKISDEVKEHEI